MQVVVPKADENHALGTTCSGSTSSSFFTSTMLKPEVEQSSEEQGVQEHQEDNPPHLVLLIRNHGQL